MQLVFEKLPLHQGIRVDPDLSSKILSELRSSGFPDFLRPAAEDWILNGNWRYKSPKTLTVQDFYPTAEQLTDRKKFISLDEHLESLSLNEKRLKQAYGLQLETKLDILFKREFAGRKSNASEYGLQVLDATGKIKDLQNRIDGLVLENARLKDRLIKIQVKEEAVNAN